MLRSLATAKGMIRALGVVNGLLLVAHRGLSRATGGRARIFRYYVVAQPVPTEERKPPRQAPGSVIGEVAKGDPRVAEFPRPAQVISGRFDSGARCFVAEVKGKFAGFLWLAFGGYDEDEVRCRFEFSDPEASAWDFDVYVAPDFRMGRTFVRLWDAANRELISRGVQWTFSRISAFNPRSVSAHRRMGMQTLFSTTFLCIGRLQIAFLGSRPFFHVGWADGQRPVLILQTPNPTPVAGDGSRTQL